MAALLASSNSVFSQITEGSRAGIQSVDALRTRNALASAIKKIRIETIANPTAVW